MNLADFNLFCQTLILGKLAPTGFKQKHTAYTEKFTMKYSAKNTK